MADMMQTAMDFFAEKMIGTVASPGKACRTVTYRRGEESVELSAMLGQSQLVPLNTLGMEPAAADELLADPSEVDRDYIIQASALILDDDVVEPMPGDKIDDTNDEDGVTHRYEVASLPSQTPWRRLKGSYKTLIRIHTKYYGTV